MSAADISWPATGSRRWAVCGKVTATGRVICRLDRGRMKFNAWHAPEDDVVAGTCH